MLLKTLKMKNFRQFKGEQLIFFSTEPDKNVTMIMGAIGSGKTTLAQAFTWCLFGETSFDDKTLLSRLVLDELGPSAEEKMSVEVTLEHNGVEYVIIREQTYGKDSQGNLRRPGQAVLNISYKDKDGQTEYLNGLDMENRMQEILPKELSTYFFFDGERIENMSKEVRRGRSREFAEAVQSLLGLSAFREALNHLKDGRGSVIRTYDQKYDDSGDGKMTECKNDIERYATELDKINKRLDEIDRNEIYADEAIETLNEKIRKNSQSEELAKQRDDLRERADAVLELQQKQTASLLRRFNKDGPAYLAKKLINDVLESLSDADKLDKGIPDIHERTIRYLIKRQECICGAEIVNGNEAHENLIALLDYIPPQSLGNLLGQFVKECEHRSKQGGDFFENLRDDYGFVRSRVSEHTGILHDIQLVEQKLEGMESVGGLQRDLSKYINELRTLRDERDDLNKKKGSIENQKKRREADRKQLASSNDNNRKIEVYKAYAQYMYDVLAEEYRTQEVKTRTQFEKTINEIFKQIYDGGLSLAVDEKYSIEVMLDDYSGQIQGIETSTAQSISIIFAFIVGVIKMARESQRLEDGTRISEVYPLVMDAPLSAFDKDRIKTVCEVLPNVAEQVIIFIKDTDGDYAEEYMSDRLGARYTLDKRNELETYVIGGQ